MMKVVTADGVLPCHHQELVDLRVFELVVGIPHFGLQLLLDPVVCFTYWMEEPFDRHPGSPTS